MSTALYDTNIQVKRNNIELAHPWQPFKRGDRAKAGERFPGITLTAETDEEKQQAVANFVNFYGLDNTLQTFQSVYTVICQQTSDVVQDELEKMAVKPGSPEYLAKYKELFEKYMAELTTRGETIDELKAINSLLSNEIAELVVSQQEFIEKGTPDAMLEVMRLGGVIKSKSANIKRNTLTIESKARPRKPRAGDVATPEEAVTA